MNHVTHRAYLSSMTLIALGVSAADAPNQQYIDSIVQDLFSRRPLTYTPLRGGISAQINLVTATPETMVVRKMNERHSFEECVKECVIGELCAQHTIGPQVYAADPAHKLVFLEYLESKASPRKLFGTQPFLQELGSLVHRFHTLNQLSIKKNALEQYNCNLEVVPCNLYALESLSKQIEQIPLILEQMGLSIGLVKKWIAYFKAKLYALHKEYDSSMVFTHGDLHWGNCLYAYDRFWLIDYESCGLAPWWYDLGVIGAHFSFSENQDDYLLEGYFGISKDTIKSDQKQQYQCMKYIALLFYASNRLSRFSLETIQNAITANVDFVALFAAYKNGSFSLASEYEHAQLAVAMIKHVGEKYSAIARN